MVDGFRGKSVTFEKARESTVRPLRKPLSVLLNIHLCSSFARLQKSSVLVTHCELLEKELVLMILHEPHKCFLFWIMKYLPFLFR
ncbi:hypothetical protein OPV22_011857 [Ensete ventricosum]|uniref:Uncharacterized protein n=1 Tax=Ensete ventricosum TaxID=4639 RepID=A0AAV8Q6I2_ENSVE|nr:hypothetical protein OPV22_011857 [Ensete ventricosum]